MHYPPWLEKILKFTSLKWLKMHYNHTPWLEKNLKFTSLEMAKNAIQSSTRENISQGFQCHFPQNQGNSRFSRSPSQIQCFSRVSRFSRSGSNADNVCPSDLKQLGETLMSLSFGRKFDQSLCSLRYIKYINQLTTTVSKIKPEYLPPTSRATYCHSLHVYIQIWIWRHLEPNVMDPKEQVGD